MDRDARDSVTDHRIFSSLSIRPRDGGKAIPLRNSCSGKPITLQNVDKAISPRNNSKAISLRKTGKAISPQDNNRAKIMSLHDCNALDHGDNLNSDDEEYDELWEYTEGYAGYYQSRYFPIRIGDVLNQTYRIEHKLGHGAYSTVWLAHDIQKKRAVALKVIVSGNAGENEYNMQKEVISTVKDTSNLLTYLTTFTVPGYKDNHRVLVFPVLGSSLTSTRHRHHWDVSMATRMSAARQLLKALERLHNAGIVHQGESTLACFSLSLICSVHT
jgi:protein kinase-like protein